MLKRLKIAITILVFSSVSLSAAAPMPTCTYTPTPGGWDTLLDRAVVNGSVYALAATANSIYLGGFFTKVASSTGCGVPMDPATGNIIPGFPKVSGWAVGSAEPDGAGGWYIGGDFNNVAGVARSYLVHIYSNGALDPVFNPTLTTTPASLKLIGSSLYMGIAVGYVDGVWRTGIAKLDATTGALDTNFNIMIPGGRAVYQIIYDGAELIICGSLWTVGGQERDGIAKIDPATGALDASFNANMNSSSVVEAMVFDGTNIYIGGAFGFIAGQARANIAKINYSTGALDPQFNPGAGVYYNYVNAMAYDGASIFFGGDFLTAGGQARDRLAKADAVTGALDPAFNPDANGTVSTMAYDGANIFIGGQFTSVGGQARNYLAKINPATGAVDPVFDPAPFNSVLTCVFDGANVFVGGRFTAIGGTPRHNIARISNTTGALDTQFVADVSDTVNAIAADPSGNVYIGGYFTGVNGQFRSYLAKLDGTSGDLDAVFAPLINGAGFNVRALLYENSTNSVVLGGSFTTVGGYARNNAAKVDAVTGVTDQFFDPNLNWDVYSLLESGQSIYIGGGFTSVAGFFDSGAAKVDKISGAPDQNFKLTGAGSVYSLACDGANLYVGGTFSYIDGQYRNNIARLNAATGSLDPGFNGSVSGSVYALGYAGNTLFAGGFFNDADNQMSSQNLVKMYADTGALDMGFNPNPDRAVYALAMMPYGAILHAGGDFTLFGNMAAPGYAAIGIANAPTFTVTETWTISQTPTLTFTATVTATPTLKNGTDTRTRTSTITFTRTPFYTATLTSTLTPIPVYPAATYTPAPFAYSLINGFAVDGTVYAVTVTSTGIYIGGNFTQVGIRTGSWLPVNGANGLAVTGYPQVVGTVMCEAPDGAGGWYIGGQFTYTAGLSRSRLAHIFANGSLDTAFNPAPNNDVYALYFDGTNLYAGGYFSFIGGQSRSWMAKLNGASGAVVPAFNPQVAGYVGAILPDGANGLYIGGWFDAVGGQTRNNIAKVNAVTGAADLSFDPEANDRVTALAYDGASVFVAGYFTAVGSLAQSYIAKVDAVTGVPDPGFNPALDSSAAALLYAGGSLYVGGAFNRVNGYTSAARLAKLDPSSGSMDFSFTADMLGNSVSSLYYDPAHNEIFAGGQFTGAGGQPRSNLAKLDAATGLADSAFMADTNGAVYTAAYDGANLFIGGNFTGANCVKRRNLAKINPSTMAADAAFPEAGGTVYALAAGAADYIYAGGDFLTLGGATRYRLGKINSSSDTLDAAFYPFVDSTVRRIIYNGPDLYICGSFTSVFGYSRLGIAKLNSSDSMPDLAFNANVGPPDNASVDDMAFDGTNLYIIGYLNGAGGVATGVVKVNALSGAADPDFIIGLGGSATAIEYGNGMIYVGGDFQYVNGKGPAGIAMIDAASGMVDQAFDTGLFWITSLFYDGFGSVYAGNGYGSNRFYASTGYVDQSFNPGLDGPVYAFAASGNVLYAGGSFTSAFKLPAPGFAAVYIANPPTPTITRTRTPGGTPSKTFTRTITLTMSPTRTRTCTASSTFTNTPAMTPTLTRTQYSYPTQTFTPSGPGSVLESVITDGPVYAITTTANDVYIGGAFTWISRRTGPAIPFGLPGNASAPGYPQVSGGSVYAIISDGADGWFIGGDFTYVSGLQKTSVAHILANFSVDPDFTVNLVKYYPDPAVIYALKYDGAGNLYIGGDFNTVNGSAFGKLAKVNAVTGATDTSFNANMGYSMYVYALELDGAGGLYLGGWFETVGGVSRNYLARVLTSNGSCDTSFNPPDGGIVHGMLMLGGYLYICGEFTYLGGTATGSVARLNPSTGAPDTSFITGVNYTSKCMAADGAAGLYVGGTFYDVSGVMRTGVARLNLPAGTLDLNFNVEITPPPYSSDDLVTALALDGLGNLYIGGFFISIDGQPRSNAAKVNAATGAVVDAGFKPDLNNAVKAIAVNQDIAYCGGRFDGINRVMQPKLARIKASTGMLDSTFNPIIDGDVNVLLLGNNSLYAGGAFLHANGFPGPGAARLNLSNGATDAGFRPVLAKSSNGVNPVVNGLAFDGNSVYIGGDFDLAGGQVRNNMAKVDAITGALDMFFNPSAINIMAVWPVRELIYDNGSVYACGGFISVNGKLCTSLAKINAYDGMLDAVFNPGSFDSAVMSIALHGNELYVGGYFTDIGGRPRNRLAMLNSTTGVPDPSFNPDSDGPVYRLAFDGMNLYAGGVFSNISGQPRARIAKITCPGGALDAAFNPGANDIVQALAFSPAKDVIHVGGNFTEISGLPELHYAAMRIDIPPTPTITQTHTASPTYTISRTFTASPIVSPTATPSATGTITLTKTVTLTPTITCTGTITPTPSMTSTETITPVFTPAQKDPVLVFPNPAKGVFTVRFKDGMGAGQALLMVYTTNFRLVVKNLENANAQNSYAVDVSSLANGIYYIKAALLKDNKEIFKRIQPVVVLR